MRICQIMAGDEEGGLENHFAALAGGLAALGDQVTVIAHERYRDRLRPAAEFLPLDLAGSRRNPLLRRRLRRLVEHAAPDIVHAHAGKAAALLAAIEVPAPAVGTVHGVKRNLAAYRRFDAVIGVSPGVLAKLDHPRKFVVFNGVAPPPEGASRAALRAAFAIPAGQSVTVAVGRLARVKRFDRVVELWDAALGHLLVLGDGPERPSLERLAAGKPVTFGGFRSDARALMAGADLMVCASEREGFGYVIAEALHARLPVVSTPVPGALDMLPASQLAPPDRLRDAIAACLGDLCATRARMQEAFAWAAATLTLERMVRATREVYAEFVA